MTPDDAPDGGERPVPDVLREYEEVAPGYADRLLAEMERNGEHRRKMDRDALTAQKTFAKDRADYARRGQVCATTVGLGALTAAAVLGVAGDVGGQVVAGIIGAGGLGSLVWAFTRYPTTRAAEDAGDAEADAGD
jgi:hypothetical protein